MLIRTIRGSIFYVRENKIIPSTISPGMPEQQITASSEKYILQVFLARVMCDLAGFHSRDWEVHEE